MLGSFGIEIKINENLTEIIRIIVMIKRIF
jgi:hypothetical protein